MSIEDKQGQPYNHFFVEAQSTGEKAKPARFVVLSSLEADQVKKCVASILTREEVEGQITIEKIQGQEITYRSGDEVKTCTVDVGKEWKVKLLKAKTKEAKLERATWKSLYNDLKSNWPLHVPIIGYLSQFYLAPLVATIQYLRFSASKQASQELDSLLDALNVKDSNSFRTLLEHAQDVVEEIDSTAAKEFSDAIVRSYAVEEAFSEPGGLDTLSQEWAKALCQAEDEGHVMNLATGYYSSSGLFSPVILTFSIHDGRLNLDVHNLSSERGDVVTQVRYSFEKRDEKALATFLKEALTLQASPKEAASLRLNEKQKITMKVLQKAGTDLRLGQEEVAAPSAKKPARDRQEQPAQRFGDYALLAGGKPITGSEKIHRGARDPWKLAQKRLLSAENEPEMALQIKFSIDLINQELELLCKAASRLSPEKQELVLHDLRSRLTSLERDLKQYLGETEAYKTFVEKGPFARVFARIEELQDRLTLSAAKRAQLRDDGIENGFRAEKTTKIALQIPFARTPKTKQVAPLPVMQYRVTVDSLQAAITQNESKAVLDTLSSCREAINDLVTAGRFNEALQACDSVLLTLPTPIVTEKDSFWKSFDFQGLDLFGEVISDITKCQWEASVKLHNTHPSPTQAVALMNSRAALMKIARLKSTMGHDRTTQTYRKYYFDFQPFIHLLKRDPSFRPPVELGSRLASIEAFFEDDRIGRIPIRLDAIVDAPSADTAQKRSYVMQNDNQYLNEVAKVQNAQDINYWSQLSRKECTGSYCLPTEIVDLRRHMIMTEMMLRPEFTSALSFSDSPVGVLKAATWADATYRKACELEEVKEKRPQKMAELSYQELSRVVDTMGRLELRAANYVVDSQPVVQVYAVNKPSTTFTYVPWGLDLPSGVSAFLNPQPNNDRNRDLAGQVPEEWVESGLGLEGKLAIKGSYSAQNVYTEAGLLDVCLQSASANIIDEYLMRLLNYTPAQNEISPQRVVEALDLIRVRPDLLEDERVRNTIDLIFMQPHVLHLTMLKYPKTLETFSKELKAIIDNKIALDKDQSAGFLMHLGARIKQEAANLQRNHVQMMQTYKFLPEFGRIGYQQEPIEDIAKKTPDFETAYGPQEKKGSDWLKTFATDSKHDPSLAQFRLVEHCRDRHMTGDALTVDEQVQLLKARSILQCAAFDVANPAANIALSRWIDDTFLPSLVHDKNRDAVLDKLSKIATPGGPWVQDKKNPYVFKNNDISIDLLKLESEPFLALLPRAFCTTSQLYISLFAGQNFPAKVVQGRAPDTWLYEFQHEGRPFRLEYNSRTAEGELLQQFEQEWYSYVIPETKDLGISHLLSEFGLWINRDNPKTARLQIANDHYSVTLDKYGGVQKIETKDGKVLVTDQDGDLAWMFTATHANHLLFFRDPQSNEVSEIRSVDIGLTLIKKEGRWVFEKRAAGYEWVAMRDMHEHVSTECINGYNRIRASLGDDFSALGISGVQKGKGIAVVLWPHTLSRENDRLLVSHGESTKLEQEKIPFEITIDQNGDFSGSAAAFCYMAYACMNNKEYTRALHFLSLAEQSRLNTAEDQEAFLQVTALIRAMQPQSRRALSLQIKAEMLLLKIQRQQLGQYSYDPERWAPYFANVQRACDLFDRLQALGPSPREAFEQDILLNTAELGQLQALSAEGMRFFLDAFGRQQAEKAGKGLQELVLKPISTSDIDSDFAVTLTLFAQDPVKDKVSREMLVNPSQFGSELLLKYFSWYFNELRSGKLKKDDLLFLFRPLEAPQNDEQRLLVEQADKARRLLYQMASAKSRENIPEIKLDALIKQRNHLPKTLGGGLFQTAFHSMSSLIRKAVFEKKGFIDALNEIAEGKDVASTLQVLYTPVSHAASITEPTEKLLMPKTDMQAAPLRLTGKRLIDLQALKTGFETAKRQGLLTPAEQKAFQEVIKEVENQKQVDPFALERLVQTMNQFGILDMRREEAVRRDIAKAIERLQSPTEFAPMASHELTTYDIAFKLDDYFEKPSDTRVKKIKDVAQAAEKNYFQDAPTASAMDKQENAEIRQGLQVASKNLTVNVAKSRIAKPKLKEKLKIHSIKLEHERDVLHSELLEWAKNEGQKIPSIREILKHPELYSEQDLLDELLDLYQSLHPENSAECAIEKIATKITSYLLLATAVQQIDIAIDAKSPSFENLQRGLNLNRYQKDGALMNPQYSRKYLVVELRSKVTLREGQLKSIEALADNPEQWMSLRMGLGKTSYIMPCVALLLAEKRKLPILLVPTPLREMNLSDFDKTTRKVMGKAGEPLVFSSDMNVSSGYLAGQYLHMLQVKQQSGYLVSTVDSLANIKNLLNVLSDERKSLLSQLENVKGDEEDRLLTKLYQLEKKLYWLEKIEVLLDGNVEGVDTIFIGDEVDSLFMITKEMNRAMGSTEKLDQTIRSISRTAFMTILENPQFEKLKTHLKNGTQASIKSEKLKEELLAVAIELTKNAEIQDLVPAFKTLTDDERQAFAQYAVGQPVKISLEYSEPVAAIKRLLSVTLPSVFSQEPDVRFGYSEEDGATIVPREGKVQTPGNRFGDEYEVIAAQLLGAIQMAQCKTTGPALQTFLEKALSTYEERYPADYKSLLENLQAEPSISKAELVKKLLEKDNYKERMGIMERLVLDVGYVSRYEEQSTLSVQSTVTGRKVGGVTGTLNPYALPNYTPKPDLVTREVEAETFLQMAVMHEKGLDTACNEFDEEKAKEYIQGLFSKDSDTVAIINEGGYGMKGMTTLDWVEELRTKNPSVSFVFVDPVVRKPFLWLAGEMQKPIIIEEKTKLPEQYVCVFGPSDCRGTDLPIQKGNTHYFPLRTTNLQDMGQAIWRGRKTGDIHAPVWHVPKGMFTTTPTIGQVLQRIKENSVERQGQLNLKAQLFRVRELADHGVRKMLFTPTAEEDSPEYWSSDNKEAVTADIYSKNLVYEVFRPYLIKAKKVSFEADFAPNEFVDTTKQIESTFDSEREKLAKKLDELANSTSEVFFSDIPQEDRLELIKAIMKNYSSEKPMADALKQAVEQLASDRENQLVDAVMQQLPDQAKPYIRKEEVLPLLRSGKTAQVIVNEKLGWMASMVPADKLAEIDQALTAARQALQEINDAKEQVQGIKASESRALQRVCDAHVKVVAIQNMLNEAKKAYKANEHEQYLPAKVAKATAGAGGTQEQVQQQQQQQQQEQQKLQKLREKPTPDKVESEFIELKQADIESPISSKEFSSFSATFPHAGLEGIYISKEMSKVCSRIPALQGDPLGHVCVNAHGDVLVISKLDYLDSIQPKLRQVSDFTVFTAGPSGYSLIDSVGREQHLPADKAARVKLLLGFSEDKFTPAEKKALDAWKMNLPSDTLSRLKNWYK